MKLDGIDHVALAVSDLDRSIAWYADVLGLERRFADAWDGPPIMMCAGDSCVALFRAKGEPRSPGSLLHVAFRMDRAGFDVARAELEERGIAAEFEDHGVSIALYFDDPDGHTIELTTYEV